MLTERVVPDLKRSAQRLFLERFTSDMGPHRSQSADKIVSWQGEMKAGTGQGDYASARLDLPNTTRVSRIENWGLLFAHVAEEAREGVEKASRPSENLSGRSE